MNGDWEIVCKYDRWMAIERSTEEMVVASSKEELLSLINKLEVSTTEIAK